MGFWESVTCALCRCTGRRLDRPKKSAIFGRWRHPLSITIPSVCLISERKRAIDDYRHLLQTMSLIIPFILFAVIITVHISCTGSRRRIDRVFAVTLESLPRIGVVELTNAPYPKHVPFACRSALTNIVVTPASHWILEHNTFEGGVTNYWRAIDWCWHCY